MAQGNRDPFQAWIDLGERRPPLKIRPRRPGETFQPLGMGGHSLKVSDFMINQKIPRRARARYPLVVTGEEIVWIPGYPPAHPFRVRAESRQVIRLRLLGGAHPEGMR